jgi:dipeptidyl-peptidase-4
MRKTPSTRIRQAAAICLQALPLFWTLGFTLDRALAEALPIERVFAPPALGGPSPRSAQLSPDGRFAAYLKPELDDQTTFDLWIAPLKRGQPRLLVSGSALEPKGSVLTAEEKNRRERERIGGDHGVVDFRWDERGDALLIPAAGVLYLADPSTGALRRLGPEGGKASDAKISPGGGYVAFVRDHNLHLLSLKSGLQRALTEDGAGTVSYGVAEFVAQEEMNRQTGYWIAPGDGRIAFTKVDVGPVDVVPRVDIGAAGVTIEDQRYPRAGRPNASVQLFVEPLAGGAPVKVDLGSDPAVYLARVDWSRSGAVLYVQRETRDQTRLDLLAVDPVTGRSRIILTEKTSPWINLNDDFTPLASGDFL